MTQAEAADIFQEPDIRPIVRAVQVFIGRIDQFVAGSIFIYQID
ncbi:MAG: hypothetical protein U5P10_05090 [Spirochaetia bacterium]|nr:hypothetical protein [Spirochaetia bacterium]